MEQKFSNNSLDLQTLREFCEREGEAVFYRKGDQMEREGDPSRWFGFVTEGCFKYVTHEIGSDREHITWFSFEGEYVGDYLLELDFNDGRRVVFDCQPLINQYKLFAPLRDKDVFARFALDGWTVTWLDDTVDIAPEHLYELGKAA